MFKKSVLGLFGFLFTALAFAGQMSFQTPTPTTGTGNWVLSNSPTLVTPNIGAATGTSLNVSTSITGQTFNITSGAGIGSLSGNGQMLMGASTTGGLQMAGQGSTNDIAIYNKNISLIMSTPTGTTDLSLVGSFTSKHLLGNSSTPTIAAGTGAGTTPTVSVSGNDTDMQVTITTGTTPAGSNATIATITYNATFGTTPHPTFSPANANSAALTGTTGIFLDGASATTYTIKSGATALTASTTYLFNVHTMN
jgi:hypothetical protein